jgi:hypothetical protein
VDAKEEAQRYKIGKFILETKRVVGVAGWEDGDGGLVEEETMNSAEVSKRLEKDDDDVVVFDSEDEDECEDLFAGIWDPEVAAKQRGRRVVSRKRDERV